MLSGKKAVITGGTRGLGLEVARKFIQYGADVCICGRDKKVGNAALDELGTNACAATIDVTSQDLKPLEYYRPSVLVCCAGMYGPKGRFEELGAWGWMDWVETVRINLLGVANCCNRLIPSLKRSHGKIILISGGGATKPMPYFTAYAASKAAVVSFGASLAEELRGQIDVNMVAPGALNTRMLDEVLEAGPERVGEKFYQEAVKQKENGGASIERAAELVAYLASSKSDGITGKLVSAVWDDWENMETYRRELERTDAWTLRRQELREHSKCWDTCHE